MGSLKRDGKGEVSGVLLGLLREEKEYEDVEEEEEEDVQAVPAVGEEVAGATKRSFEEVKPVADEDEDDDNVDLSSALRRRRCRRFWSRPRP